MSTPLRRLPAPWTVTPFEGGYAVEDSSGVRLAYVYFGAGDEDRPDLLTPDDARLVANGIAHLPELIRAAEAPPVSLPQERAASARPVRPPKAADGHATSRVRMAEGLASSVETAGPGAARSSRRGTMLPWVLPAGFMVVTLVVLLHALDDPDTGRSGETSGFRKFLSLSR